MSKEDVSLPAEMGKLEIEPVRTSIAGVDDNPFMFSPYRVNSFAKSFTGSKCHCHPRKINDIALPISKKKTKKIIKEPTLRLLPNGTVNNAYPVVKLRNRKAPFVRKPALLENVNLSTLVDNCNQLRISNNVNESNPASCSPDQEKETNWRHKTCKRSPEQQRDIPAGPSCSQEALNPPCDVTIDELASYFETLVHIPKKMSSMAEMMYI